MSHKFDPRRVAKLDDPQRLTWQPPDTVLGLLDLSGDETVVDYGAGTGAYTIPLARALPRGFVVAVDMHAELLERLEQKLDDEIRTRVLVVQTSVNRVPQPDGAADAVLAVNLLHEIFDEPPALLEIARLLGHGGRFVVVDWAQMERPVGPPAEHVLTVTQALTLIEGMGLQTAAVHEPGELFPYHYAIVATLPDA